MVFIRCIYMCVCNHILLHSVHILYYSVRVAIAILSVSRTIHIKVNLINEHGVQHLLSILSEVKEKTRAHVAANFFQSFLTHVLVFVCVCTCVFVY